MKKTLIRIIALTVAGFVLAIIGLFLLTEQPAAPIPEFPSPKDRDEAWRQDIAFLRDEFLNVGSDVDLPVTVSFQDYLSGHDPVLEAISSR